LQQRVNLVQNCYHRAVSELKPFLT